MTQRQKELFWKGLLLLGVIGLAIWINTLELRDTFVYDIAQQFGYLGVFLAAIVSGFNVIIPIPLIAFFPTFVEIGLHPGLIIATVSLGMVFGDLLGYFLGRAGRATFEPKNSVMLQRLEGMRSKHPLLPLVALFFYAGFAPAPNELVVIPMGYLKFPLWQILAAVLLGNVIFNVLAALGIVHITSFFSYA